MPSNRVNTFTVIHTRKKSLRKSRLDSKMDIYKCPKWENRPEKFRKNRFYSVTGQNTKKIILDSLPYFFIMKIISLFVGEI